MSDPETLPAGVHPEVGLLPWYATGTLSESDRERIARHLQSCRDCSAELEDLIEVRRTLQALSQQEAEPSPQLARSVMARVAADSTAREGRPRGEAAWTASLDRWFRSLFMPQWVPTLAAAILLVQTGLLVWVALPPRESGEIGTRSLGMQAVKIAVVFQPSATEEQIRSLLQQLHARFVDGPTGDGVFTISLNTGDPSAAATLAMLHERRDLVRSAEVVQP
jgi:anti-sigma factor RsiW